MTRRFARVLASALALFLGGASPASADPQEGEARSILRDADRIYTTIAGEADAAATVTNPANLGFLQGVSGIVDVAFTAPRARRRGSGVGAFLGVPLPFDIASLGLGYQLLLPLQQDPGDSLSLAPGIDTADEIYSKVSFALALPLVRWVPGLSLGLSYARIVSKRNFHADGLNQVDLAASYWVNRFLALGVVARGLNQPKSGGQIIVGGTLDDATVVQPLTLDPELAFRPLGNRALEVAVGARTFPTGVPSESRFRTGVARTEIEPHARLLIAGRGVKFFAEAQTYRFFPVRAPGDPLDPDDRTGVSVSAGFELDFAHFGAGVSALLGAGGRSSFAADGAAARLRFSEERYPALPVRPRRVTRVALAGYGGDSGMWDVVSLLDDLGRRRGVVILETRGMGFRLAQIEEIREAVLRLRERGGKVVVYLQGGSLSSYFLASAADRVIAHPHDSLNVVGLRGRTLYYATLLERLGAKADFVRIADYKGVPEQYHRTTASEPVGRQRRQLRGDIWNHLLRLIARERGHDPLAVKRFIDEAPHPPRQAMAQGMVDELAFPDELDARMENWLGKPVRIDVPPKKRRHLSAYGPPARVAVVHIEGDLLDGASVEIPLLGRKIAGAKTLTKTIERLRKDNGVKAVVVRCNTPGGSVSAADAIARELDLLRAEKPVVISMGPACASGGYYIATAGQYIYTDATTVTGSIGIFYPKMDLSGTLEKFGVGIDEEGLGAHSLMRSWWKPYSDDERKAAQDDIQHSYDIFIERVARARTLEPEDVDRNLAGGRVWSGARAVEVGLADSYGGLRESIMRARAIAGLEPTRGEVEHLPVSGGLIEQVRSLFGIELPSPLVHRLEPGRLAASPLVPILSVLAELSPALWMVSEPTPLALDPEPMMID